MSTLSAPPEMPMNILSIAIAKEEALSISSLLGESKKYRLFSVSSPEDALGIFAEKKIDLVLLDLKKGQKERLKVASFLKKHLNMLNTPFILLTDTSCDNTFPGPGYPPELIDYLTKPLDKNRLLQKLALYHKLFLAEKSLLNFSARLESTVEELNEKRVYLDNILHSTRQLAFVAIDLDFKIRYCNHESERLFGYEAKKEIGNDIFLVIKGEKISDGEFQFALQELIREGEFRFFYFRKKNGAKIVIDIRISFIKDQAGNRVGYLLVGHDTTESKNRERDLNEKARRLAQSNRELEQLAYIISHDLREPLRTVSGFARILEESCSGKMDEDMRESLGYIKSGITHMKNMVNALFSYSRVGVENTHFKRVDCNKLLENTLSALTVAIEERDADIVVDQLPSVYGNEVELFQLFQNLIENSMKFCTRHPPQVHIKAKEEGDMWLFSVTDNGIGIKGQYSERVFKIFQRLHARNEYPGTGIGLAICKKIVENHSGRIWIESAEEKGAIFYFLIPKINQELFSSASVYKHKKQ